MTTPSSQITPPAVYDYFQAALAKQPEYAPPADKMEADPRLWPTLVYSHSPHVTELWALIAEQRGVKFYPLLSALLSVNTELNLNSHEALKSGVLWVQKEREFTPRERTLGVTFHPAVARENIFLTTPQEWHFLFDRVFPVMTNGDLDAERITTLTIEWDKPDYEQLTSKMRRNVLRLMRGIESGEPQHTPLSPEAFTSLSTEFMQMYHVIPFRRDDDSGTLLLYMTNVDDQQTIDRIYRMTRYTVRPYHMEKEDEAAFWEQYNAANQIKMP